MKGPTDKLREIPDEQPDVTSERRTNTVSVVMVTVVLVLITAALCYLQLTGQLYFSTS